MAAQDEEDTPLAKRLKERIRREGPIPFHEFMRVALYDPDAGYYAQGPRIGPDGDFSTSVRFPAFRKAMFRLVLAAYEALERPPDFRVVELGAGTGQLARSITEEWRAALPDAPLRYVTVDASPALRARQAAVPGVESVAAPRDLAPAPGIVFGNEVLDALPVHRIVGGPDDALLEMHVGVDERTGRFRERLLPLAEPRVAVRLAAERVKPERGQVIEVALGVDDFVRDAARLVERGFLLLIDYGAPAHELYAPTQINGTLRAYRDHGEHHDPYARVGAQDLTADVDFTAVAYAARDAGMEELGLTSQEQFLDALGIADLGLPDEVYMVAGAAGLGSAFQVAAFRRGTTSRLPGF